MSILEVLRQLILWDILDLPENDVDLASLAERINPEMVSLWETIYDYDKFWDYYSYTDAIPEWARILLSEGCNLFCTDCDDCKGCWFCTNCIDCANCDTCHDCMDCIRCTDCEGCEDCDNCDDCTNVKNQDDASGMEELED